LVDYKFIPLAPLMSSSVKGAMTKCEAMGIIIEDKCLKWRLLLRVMRKLLTKLVEILGKIPV